MAVIDKTQSKCETTRRGGKQKLARVRWLEKGNGAKFESGLLPPAGILIKSYASLARGPGSQDHVGRITKYEETGAGEECCRRTVTFPCLDSNRKCN